jgi:hypothetical protein
VFALRGLFSYSRRVASTDFVVVDRLGRCSPCNLSAMVVVIAADPAVDTGSVVGGENSVGLVETQLVLTPTVVGW